MLKKLQIILLLFLSCAPVFRKEKAPVTEPATSEARAVEAENYVADGIDYYKSENYLAAVKKWQQALEIIPNDAEVHNFAGLAYHRLGNLDSAIVEFSQAVKLNPQYYQAWNNLGYMYFLKGEYEKALPSFRKSLEINPYYDKAKTNLETTQKIIEHKLPFQAFELIEQAANVDSLELKIRYYREALRLDSNYVEAWNNLGVAYYYFGLTDSAVICLKKALEINPDYPPAHNNAGYILDSIHEYQQAIAHYQKAIQLRPDYIVAMANLMDTYLHLNDDQSAAQILELMKKLNPNHYLVRQREREFQQLERNNLDSGGK